jgi:hypothetical protein
MRRILISTTALSVALTQIVSVPVMAQTLTEDGSVIGADYISRSADIAALALSEGCLASATPSIAALTLAAILTIARAFHVLRR